MSTLTNQDTGIVYVASGACYLEEAVHSIASVKKHNPNCPVYLLCNEEPPRSCLADRIEIDLGLHRTIKDKLAMVRSPFRYSLFLDTDTYVAGDISEIFRLLKHFDLCAHQSGGGYEYTILDVPDVCPEFNTGVLGFRKSPRMERFFRQWMHYFEAFENEMGREWDQRSFRAALWRSAVRIAPLPNEWNFMPHFIQVAHLEVKVVHGRINNPNRVARMMNVRMSTRGRFTMPRAFVPKLGRVYHHDDATLLEIGLLAIKWIAVFLLESGKRTLGLFPRKLRRQLTLQ